MHTASWKSLAVAVLAVVVIGTPAFGASFIVPPDAEMVKKSDAILTGVVIGARSAMNDENYVETTYEIAVDRVFKGPIQARTRMEIVSAGGTTETRWTLSSGAAHFSVGEPALIFLLRHRGGWAITDGKLGKFRYAYSRKGYNVMVRDLEDAAAWDVDGQAHEDKLRMESEFLFFVEETAAGRTSDIDYELGGDQVDALPADQTNNLRIGNDAAFPAHTYANSGKCLDGTLTRYTFRWTDATMNAGVQFRKNSNNNATNTEDGGVSLITNALASWTNDCGSAINLSLGATTTALLNDNDGINAILFNDPTNYIPGSGNSGQVGDNRVSGNDIHTFDGFANWVIIDNSDIILQDGFAGNDSRMPTVLTHEFGHGIGLRHSDKHHVKTCSSCPCVNTETACQEGTEECSTSSIMTSVTPVGGPHQFTLQTWDRNAANALYPATCVALTPPTNVLATATSSTTINVTWTTTGAPSYRVHRGVRTGGNIVFTQLAGAPTGTSFTDTVAPNSAFLYKVTSSDGVSQSADSNIDLATSIIFSDATIVAGTTQIDADHITQLRTAVNAVQNLAGQTNTAYTDPALNNTVPVKAAHITELRSRITTARNALAGVSAPSFTTDPAITPGTTTIKKAHIDQLRAAVR